MKITKLTEKQVKEMTNGCGGKGSIIKPPYRVFFEASCNIHDANYVLGGIEDKNKIKVKLKYNSSFKYKKYTIYYDPRRYIGLLLINIYNTINNVEDDRKKADRGFLKYMRKDIKFGFKWYDPRRYYYFLWAYLYYITVRMFGNKYFNYE